MWITSSLKAVKTPTNIALGNFDGVHLGHQRVMAEILADPTSSKSAYAQALASQPLAMLHSGMAASGYSYLSDQAASDDIERPVSSVGSNLGDQPAAEYATVVTFSPHPQEYFSGVSRSLLTPVAEKTWQLAQMGVDQLVMLPFNRALAELGPEEFVSQILIAGLQAKRISVGSDFRFGKGRSGSAEGLQEIAAGYGVPVVRVPLRYETGDRISSSRIRQALQRGELSETAGLLGHSYTLTGRVVQGKQLGRTMGFPTANLQMPSDKYLPCKGVYSVRVYGASAEPLRGVMNLGSRPTVAGQDISVEVHVLDWSGDLYGQVLTVSLESFVRPEQKFDSLASLKKQIAADCEVAIATLQ